MNKLDVIKAYTYQVYNGTTLQDSKIPYSFKGKDIVALIDNMFLHNPNSTFSYKEDNFDDEEKVKNFAYSLAFELRHFDFLINESSNDNIKFINKDFNVYPYEIKGTYYPLIYVEKSAYQKIFDDIAKNNDALKSDFAEFRKNFNIKEHLEKYSDSYNADEEFNNYNDENKIILKNYLRKQKNNDYDIFDIDLCVMDIERQTAINKPICRCIDNERGLTKNSSLHFNKTKKLNIKSEGDLNHII